jgi:multisubunit Na+/H+ antiporter MnhE subunit
VIVANLITLVPATVVLERKLRSLLAARRGRKG